MKARTVYLDNNATTPIHPEVKKTMIEAMDIYGNASSVHSFGRKARRSIEQARTSISDFIGATPDEVIFMGSGSEANNTVLNIFTCRCFSCADYDDGKCKEIITSKVEHPCVLRTSECILEKGTPVKYVGSDEYGRVDVEQLSKMISKNTGLVSIMMANNETGTIMDIKRIAAIAHANGALMHTDAVQAVGKIPVDVRDLGVDFLTFSGHKLYGPKGVGGLYVRKGAVFCPMIHGGHQEQGRRAGTENTIGIVGMGKAAEAMKHEMPADVKKIKTLRDKLKEGIKRSVSDIKFNGHPEECLPGTLNVSFEGCEGESILLYMDLEGIAASTGSACASGSLDPSHVLLAMGLGPEVAHGSIRFSFGRENTEEDVDYVLGKLPGIIERVRKMSTAYTGKGK